MKKIIAGFISMQILCGFGLRSNYAHGFTLFDYNQGSGHTMGGWTWVGPGQLGPTGFPGTNGYGAQGWVRNDAIDFGGGGDLEPRSQESTPGTAGTPDAAIDAVMRAPSTASGGSLRLSNELQWYVWIGSNTFGRLGFTDASTNRMSYYVQYHGIPDAALTSASPSGYNVEIGTFLMYDDCTSQPNVCEVNGDGHFYHQMTVPNDVWLHVVLDKHPQHLRGVSAAPVNDPYGPAYPYYRYFSSYYVDLPYYSGGPETIWFDEINLWTQTQPENDESISTVYIGRRASDGHWLLQFRDSSWQSGYDNASIGTYEVRWSPQPITNANWPSATPISPLYNAAAGAGAAPGRIRRPNSWMAIAYTEFQLPVGTESANNKLYFAVMDVSSTTYGDGHNSPSPNVKTIDYNLRPDATVVGASPARPQGLVLR